MGREKGGKKRGKPNRKKKETIVVNGHPSFDEGERKESIKKKTKGGDK